MHADSLHHLTHSHAFLGEQHKENERRTWLVVGLTFFTIAGSCGQHDQRLVAAWRTLPPSS